MWFTCCDGRNGLNCIVGLFNCHYPSIVFMASHKCFISSHPLREFQSAGIFTSLILICLRRNSASFLVSPSVIPTYLGVGNVNTRTILFLFYYRSSLDNTWAHGVTGNNIMLNSDFFMAFDVGTGFADCNIDPINTCRRSNTFETVSRFVKSS